METMFGGNSRFRMSALTDFSQLSLATKAHLQSVYSCLAMTMFSASAGAVAHLKTGIQGGFLTVILSIGLMIWLKTTAHVKENQTKRMLILNGFGATMGLGMGPILDFAIEINPQIIVTAFMASTVIFVCFSLSALWARRRSYLFLGGILSSGLSILMLTSIMNLFFRSPALFNVSLYAGTAIFALFILFDTQLIVEKHIRGDNDYIWHSVELFLDFINLFRRLIIILGLNEKKKNNSKRN